MDNLIIKVLKSVVFGKGKRKRGKWQRACAQIRTGNDVVEGGYEGMVITKIKIVVKIWGRATIRFVERDRVVFMTNFNSNASTI